MVFCPLAAAAVSSCRAKPDRWIAPHLAVGAHFDCVRWTCWVTHPVQRTPLWPTDCDATPLGQRPLSVLPVVYRIGVSESAGGGRGSVEAWNTTALDTEEFLLGAVDSDFLADVIKSFDTVDRGVLDWVLSSLSLPDRFRHVYFEYHAPC